MKNTLKVTLIALAIIAIGWSFIKWTSWHDKQIEISAEKYAACIRAEYGMEPYTYYAEHNEYPVCQTMMAGSTDPETEIEVGQ